jgi:hypothetical protein
MPVLVLALMAAFVVLGLWVAFKVAPWADKLFGSIWRPAMLANRVDVAKRVKELCVDGTMGEESAVMTAAQESNVTEHELLEAFGAVSASELKAMLSGNYKPLFGFKSFEELFGGKKRRR